MSESNFLTMLMSGCSGAIALISLELAAVGCTENYYVTLAEEDEPSGEGGQAGAPPDPLLTGSPEPDTKLGDHELDTFGSNGNRYWFVVNEEQATLMNEKAGNGPGFPLFDVGDIYAPGGTTTTFADHLFVTAAGKTADYGKIGTTIIGQSTLRAWTPRSLPNIRVDSNQFEKGLALGGEEHVRFNNGLVGSIFRERLTLELYRRLGFPVPRATFAWVGSNIWGPDIWVPYTLVEVYKAPLCERYTEELGGGCQNMWEFYGDFGQGMLASPDSCQSGICDNERVTELESLVMSQTGGEGYKAALEDWINWDNYHRFQCLSWILATGDDAIHNQNNVLLVEQLDGRFSYLPYSVDISLGQDWYPVVPLAGFNTISAGCQSDLECWNDTVQACETAIEDFTNLDPVAIADEVYGVLSEEGMLRSGDEERFSTLKTWLEDRVANLPADLDANRAQPTSCVPPMVLCGDACVLPEECFAECEPLPEAERLEYEAQAAEAGLPARIANDCLPVDAYAVE